ncbi:methionyl-tRNA formyltransferase [Halopiger xanaduensis]|uniref:Formyl transferase domain protein n=1 Tax=Halopiger xanaduensis (strain DSM 18323 / JCM 14033 / SH-6) TaxID=797210 RepID=F8DAP5_HALXS|nr:formyltransferase family protein [Halopiger xanaduensis]AEH36987.1 formyl transferase domain protein [Halopiger xanaduensis SH-6]
MSDEIDVIFLGINDAGMRVYEWLCDRDGVFVHSLLTTREQLRTIEDVRPDFLVSCGYRRLVPESILEIPTEGCVNLHPAYLPYNRGANPNVWSIVDNTPAGVTLHYMDSSLDTGDIIARRTVPTDFEDTGKDLYRRLEDAQVDLFRDAWPDIEAGDPSTITQDSDAGTYHETTDFKELCRLDPDETVRVKEFLDRLRALTFPPYDNAEIEVDGETYYVDIDITKA